MTSIQGMRHTRSVFFMSRRAWGKKNSSSTSFQPKQKVTYRHTKSRHIDYSISILTAASHRKKKTAYYKQQYLKSRNQYNIWTKSLVILSIFPSWTNIYKMHVTDNLAISTYEQVIVSCRHYLLHSVSRKQLQQSLTNIFEVFYGTQIAKPASNCISKQSP